MSSRSTPMRAPGPFRADQLREGDRYELSNGHPVQCLPGGGRHGSGSSRGAAVLETDPLVESAGVDVGFSPEPGMLRAPDVAVGNVPERPGWVAAVPPLAVEYADTGQDERELQAKIADLLGHGTRYVWVVRQVGPRRVEVYEPGRPMQLFQPGQELLAPGILKNAVPIEALYERDAAHEATLRNLLQRRGYASLEAVQAQGQLAGQAQAILSVLAARGIEVPGAVRERVSACADPEMLDRWVRRAAVCRTAAEIFEAGSVR